MKDKMKALLCYSQDDFRIEDIEKPKISYDEVLMEMIYCGLCSSDVIKKETSPHPEHLRLLIHLMTGAVMIM